MGWRHRMWNLVRHRRLVDDIDEELQFHVEASIRANVAAGMSAEEARRDALRRFGNPALLRDRARDADIVVLADNLRQDLGFAVRSLRKQPAFTAIVLATLALGIGATTAVFTVVRSMLLRPLPFPNPDSIYVVSHGQEGPGVWLYPGMSDREYLAFKEQNRSYQFLSTFSHASATLTSGGDAVRLAGADVTTEFLRVLGIDAALGRALTAEDDADGNGNIVLVADSVWRNRFGADPRLVDSLITLDGIQHRVVGVLPRGFSYPAGASFWRPLRVEIKPDLGYTRPVIGRLKRGVTRAAAQAELDTWVATLSADARPRELVARVTPLHEAMVGDLRRPLWIFGAAVAFVLLIACANVANLLLMRAVARRQEIATRIAIGAGRSRLVRQLLTESALLSIVGGLGGIVLARMAAPALLNLVPAGRLPGDVTIQMDGWVLVFTMTASLLTGITAGLAPVVQTGRDEHHGAFREAIALPTRQARKLREVLVIGEVALTLMLLVAAGLLVRSFMSLRAVPLGFSPARVTTMTLELPPTRYPAVAHLTEFHQRCLSELSLLPGVEAAAAVNWLPLGDLSVGGDLQAADRPDLVGKYNATKVVISPDYFTAMGIPLIAGRTFNSRDTAQSEGVLVVSESVAKRFWPEGDAIGKRVSLEDKPQPRDWLTVVGVVKDVRQRGVRARFAHAVYQPYFQTTRRFFLAYMTFVVRSSDEPGRTASLMRGALKHLDPNLAPQTLVPMESLIDRKIAEPRFQSVTLTVFALLALSLAALGIYGVLASAVLDRRVEIGIRMALGADASTLVRMVLQRTMFLTAIGLVIGLAVSFLLTRAMRNLLFDITPTDVPSFAIAGGVLVLAAVAAALIPARRASSIDPLIALRGH